MSDIKPIETVYNGYRFRSRLEARWAVFFDEAHIEYQYEPDGFDLDGEYYLPDFYLSQFDIYVEIKPMDRSVVKHVGDGNMWEQKCIKFRDITGNAILLCYGDPAEPIYRLLFAWDRSDSNAGTSEWMCMFSERNKHVELIVTNSWNKDVYVKDDLVTSNDRISNVSESDFQKQMDDDLTIYDVYGGPDKSSFLMKAKLAARQARFEHGETPKF